MICVCLSVSLSADDGMVVERRASCLFVPVCVCVCVCVYVHIMLVCTSVCVCVCVFVCADDGMVVERRRVGSIADYDPINEHYGSLTQGYRPTSRISSQSFEWQETVTLLPSHKPAVSLLPAAGE